MVYITFGQSVFITVSEIKLRLKTKKKKQKNALQTCQWANRMEAFSQLRIPLLK